VVTAFTMSADQIPLPEFPPIGRAIANTTILILDELLQPVPIGAKGHIYVDSANLAMGYLNDGRLTAKTFRPHPYQKGKRIYHTGDLGRWLPDGNIEFLGRKDDQVKIRGHRVEPSEIEVQLLRHEDVLESVAIATTGNKEKMITAYFSATQPLPPPKLRAYLKDVLPEYMVPSYFIQLEKLPLTPNGKIDRKALPDPLWEDRTPISKSEAPRNKNENDVLNIWREVLGRSDVGIGDNFFEFGGHSLAATRIASRIRSRLKKPIRVKDIFRYPTVKELAVKLNATSPDIEPPIRPTPTIHPASPKELAELQRLLEGND